MKCKAFLLLSILFIYSCSANGTPKNYVRMADSEIDRNPEPWMLDFSKAPKWNYTHGLVLMAMQKVSDKTEDQKYYNYALNYCDTMILDNGHKIITYKPEDYNIDRINPGRILFPLYGDTKNEKYKFALDLLRSQMLTHPKTTEGGFWHKKIYPHQMWLDGIYMGSPFLAEYAKTFNEADLFDDVANQILLIAEKTYDKETGLYFHGWDESKEQRWVNSKTGTSPNFWSRSIGWYMMAIVDVLDFMPSNHPKRDEIIKILQNLSLSLDKYRDPQTGMWYQVTDKVGKEGNYLESTGSIMFIYTWVKGAQKGYLDESYLEKGEKAYQQFLDRFIQIGIDGNMTMTDCCAVAGLGGKEYRDGSYEYYISEPVRDNDPKGTGPFILVSLLLDK